MTAIVTVVVSFAQLLTDLGIGPAIIHAETLDGDDVNTAWWINFLSGFGIATIIFSAAPLLNYIYSYPGVVYLTRVACLTFVLSFGVVHIALFERSFHFRYLLLVEVGSNVIAFGVAIAWALIIGTPTAIVVGPIVYVAILSITLWLRAPLQLRVRVSRQSMRKFIGMSASLTGFNIVNFWARNLDNLLLGHYASERDLGLYSRAYSLALAPQLQVTNALNRVMLPTFARLQHDRPEMGRRYLEIIKIVAATLFPLVVIGAAIATPLSTTLFGSAWTDMGPILAVLLASLPSLVLAGTTGAVFQAVGDGRGLLTRGGIQAAATVIAIICGLPWGGIGVAIALLIRAYLLFPLAMQLPLKHVGISLRDLLKAIAPMAVAAAVAGGSTFLAASVSSVPSIKFVFGVTVGLAVYLVLLRLVAEDLFRYLRSLAPLRTQST